MLPELLIDNLPNIILVACEQSKADTYLPWNAFLRRSTFLRAGNAARRMWQG